MGTVTYCDVDFWPLNTTLYVTDFLGNDPRFTYYLLRQIDFSGYNSGAAQPVLNRNYIKKIPISLPTMQDQLFISGLLGVLDDKIALNRRIAATAEQLCQDLFSEQVWEGRTTVEKIATLHKGQITPSTLSDNIVAHYSIPAHDAGKIPDLTDPSAIKSAKFSVCRAAVLLSKLNPEISRIWNVTPDPTMPALASTEFLVLEPLPGISTAELWAVLAQPGVLGELATKVTGTSKSHQRIRPAEVMNSEVVDPRQMSDVRVQVQALAERAKWARNESRVLAALRDSLLPELVSGRLRARTAERIVEDAV